MVDSGSPSPSSRDSGDGSIRADDAQQEVVVTSQNVSTNPKPKDYKMGSWTCLSPGGEWYIIAGGKPLADCSGLDPIRGLIPFSPLQIRKASTKARSQDYAKRVAPMETKFKQGMNLRDFMEEVPTHNDEHGLTTWHFLHDLSDTSKMLSVVAHYTKFINDIEDTVNRALKLSKEHNDELIKRTQRPQQQT